MDFTFTPAQEAFRQEVRDFLKTALPADRDEVEGEEPPDGRVDRAFSKKVAAKGWIGLPWPKEYGGKGLGYIERLVFQEEMIYAQAPVGFHNTSERQMGPSIIFHGNDYQKKNYLPAIAKADLCIGIGYSEPNSGSDLASLETAAVADGDDYLITGQKMYTTNAHNSQLIWLATRTDPTVPKHKGISVFLVPNDAKGVSVQPLYTMAGTRLNSVYLDNVRVHARDLVGEKNRGWYVSAANLDFERAGIERVILNLLTYEEVVRYAREERRNGRALIDDPIVAHRLAELAIEFSVGRLLAYRVSWIQSQGRVPNYEASITKVFGGELSHRLAQACMQVLGLYGPVTGKGRWAKLHAKVATMYLASISDSIRGGTSEVQRNIVAQRGLGLPR